LLIDMHVHTNDSPDADIPAWQLVRRGIEINLAAIGFVAHLDLNPEDYCYGSFNAAEYDKSIERAGIEAREHLTVLKGLEIGEPHLYGESLREIVDYSDYDFIIGSLHSVEGTGMILGAEVYEDRDPIAVVEQYYLETLSMVEKSDMDILAHMGLFRRGLAMAGLDHSFDETELWPDTISRILETIIERKIALELNTSGLRRKERTTYPTPEILELYRNAGGILITLGSDTHREPHVFFGLEKGRELLLEKGFSRQYMYSARTPEAAPLS